MKFSLLALPLLLCSCATLFAPGKDQVTISSKPEDATVLLNARDVGRTPVSIEVDRDFGNNTIPVMKEGHPTKTFNLQKAFEPIAILNTTSIFSWATDASTGNMIRYSPDGYFIDLTAKGEDDKAAYLRSYLLINRTALMNDLARGQGEALDAFQILCQEAKGRDPAVVPAKIEDLERECSL